MAGDAEVLGRHCEEIARARLAPSVYDYAAGGADDEVSLRRNESAYDKYALLPRVLTGVAEADSRMSLLGADWSAPLFVVPMGGHRLMHDDGERATAAAAATAGIGYVTSSAATTALEDIAAAGQVPWFQLYWLADRQITADLVRRAEAAGYGALCLTVDMPVVGLRRRDLANHYRLPSHLSHANLTGYAIAGADDGEIPYFARLIDGAVSWKDLAWLRSLTSIPLIIKGVMSPDDARIAVAEGVDGVYVSNHGGRQLGRCPSTLSTLPSVAEAVDGRVPVIFDGGVRSASDVMVALALGATAVGVGRPVLWTLAAGAREAVEELLVRFVSDLRRLMILTGCGRVGDIGSALLA